MLLTEILEKNSKEFGKNLAFTMKMGYRTKSFTYEQVYSLAKKAAIFLLNNGIAKGDKVLIFAPNSPYWTILFWGSMLNGSIFVPLNIQSTDLMIKKIVDQTEPKIIFKSKFFDTYITEVIKSYDIESLEDLIVDLDSKDFKRVENNQDDVIEILYTSGTTGDPKGVPLTHSNISANLKSVSKVFPLFYAKERLVSVLPLTHILEQTLGLFLPALYASHIIYAHSHSAILELMQKYKVTKMVVVPEFLKMMLSKIEGTLEKRGKLKTFKRLINFAHKFGNNFLSRILFFDIHKKFGGCLKIIGCGGAPLDPEVEKKFGALGFDVLQGYGLTETSPLISCNTPGAQKTHSVGKVVDVVTLRIDEDGQILVKGPSVFSGYFKDGEKNKERFTQDGFFKTGDIGWLDDEGFLFLRGRKKYVIIGPGAQNVYPEDVELQLDRVEEVKESCVVGLPMETGIFQVHAVLLLKDGVSKNNIEKIIDVANQHLASYQKISGYTVWQGDDFPRSATRKVKKDLVLKTIRTKKRGEIYRASVGEKSKLMKILSKITGYNWENMTSETRIVEDLQLDSLMKVELVLMVEQVFDYLLDESLVKEKTTIGQLQELIDKKQLTKKTIVLKKWPRSFWARAARFFLQPILFLFIRLFVKLEVIGKENLKYVDLPAIFMPNHQSYIDSLIVAMSLPRKIRKKISFAAAQDVLYQEFRNLSWLAELLFNSFSLPRESGDNVRIGLNNIGEFLDEGYSVVVFPEGQMSKDKKLKKLKKGAGLMAIEMDSCVVPIKLEGTADLVPYCKFMPKKFFGKVKVKIGKPIRFNRSFSYDSARDLLEKQLGCL